MLGIGFHSFIDGIIYSITFTASIFTGLLAATGMVLHEFPEGIITYLLRVRAGFIAKKSLLLAFLAAAVTTQLGILISYPYISRIDVSLLGAQLSFSAGALIYVGATHLLPQAESENKKYSLLALGAGIFVALVIVLSQASDHFLTFRIRSFPKKKSKIFNLHINKRSYILPVEF